MPRPDDPAALIRSERDLLAVALALGAATVPGWSEGEAAAAVGLAEAPGSLVAATLGQILDGGDPLGEAFCALRSPSERRNLGATFTPGPMVRSMLDWAAGLGAPDRVVDPGVGSGRFLVEAARRFPKAELVGVEVDPAVAPLARANLAALGLAGRSRVVVGDYRTADLPAIGGRTLYLGNPPYVRHHLQGAAWKRWLVDRAGLRGLRASQLAGLHVHFFLATADRARPGDFGAFVTAAEWLDVNYGRLVRDLFLGDLGGRRIVVIEPKASPFADAASTAAIACFEVGTRPAAIALGRASSLADLDRPGGIVEVPRAALEAEPRWSRLTRPARPRRAGFVELGELCRVHRGQVTGSNRVWIAGRHSRGLPPSVLYPSITRAAELFRSGRSLDDPSALRRVIDLPADLDRVEAGDRPAVDRFLGDARASGADRGYIAAHRRAWWSVGLRPPAPILATYMARRPPAFVRNRAGARHINIAHGVYPRDPWPDATLDRLVDFLATGISTDDGRTYAGGLTKFEPREMERLLVPGPEILGRSPGPAAPR